MVHGPTAASRLPTPHSTIPITVTLRGPTRSCQRPPTTAPIPIMKIARPKTKLVWVAFQPNAAISGWVKLLRKRQLRTVL